MIITTGDHAAPDAVRRAAALAQEAGVQYVPRNRTSLNKLASRYNDRDILVILEGGARLFRSGGEAMLFHPSMAFVRAKRLLKGESDPMLEAARIRPGDVVVDCTAGLGADSAVFALGAGPEGRVLALEDSLPLWSLLKEGFAYYVSGVKKFDDALRRITAKRAEHLRALREMPDKSADVVYFDPMFRNPVEESSAISPLRTYANASPLSPEAVAEACRVARKTVVLKEKKGSGEFERLGFESDPRPHTKIAYGVISLDK
ncbi:class I SAM-dependent methyltransferase [Paenibacillus sp. M1]|uniref:Class I SAM-dependent methyltransferase n=1 Tax=Paenibacillus haidiansis TaxID=1574488 RepID=A0ABU7VU52_9BACL